MESKVLIFDRFAWTKTEIDDRVQEMIKNGWTVTETRTITEVQFVREVKDEDNTKESI